jgi:Protein of unknown function (DUF2997)
MRTDYDDVDQLRTPAFVKFRRNKSIEPSSVPTVVIKPRRDCYIGIPLFSFSSSNRSTSMFYRVGRCRQFAALLLAALLAAPLTAFSIRPATWSSRRSATPMLLRADWNVNGNGSSGGSIEQIEFKVYSDGRVEETVRGVKGNNCHKVTESINAALGKVVATSPTEEMYEQEVVVNDKIYLKDSSSSSSSGGWEGSSSW